ncbi:hypothetical protein ACI3LZ_002351 [Candidozyma auris]
MKVWPIDPLVPRNLRLELDTNKLRRGTIQGGVCWVTERWPGGHELQCHTGGDGSFAYDLDVQRGIVSGRVALLLRSAEIKPSLSGLGAKNQGGSWRLDFRESRGNSRKKKYRGSKNQGKPGDLIFEKAEEIKDRIATAGRIHARIRNQGERDSVARLSGGLIQLSELDTNKLRRGTIQGGVCWVTERWPGGHELQCHTGGDGSFAYDLDVQRGIVSGRVALLLRSAEIKPSLSGLGAKNQGRPGDLIFEKAEEIKDRIATAGRIHARIRNQGARETVWVDPDFWEGWTVGGISIQLSELDTNKLRRGTIQGGVCWVTERWPGGHELQCHTGGDGSFAYDLDVQRGIVSGRVALLLRSAEIKPSLSGLGAKNQGRPGDLIFEKAEEIKDRIATAGRIHARIRNQGARETVWVDPDFWEGWTVGGISIQLSELDTNKLRRGTIQGGVCWVTERWPGGHELQCHTGGDGSFAYDLDVQRGIVSGRVALLLRSAEIKPSLSGGPKIKPDFWEGWTVGGISIQLSELDTNKLRRGTIQGGVCWVTERWPGGHELQCHTGGDGSFAYDLDVQRGIVSGRVALLLRSAEIKPSLSGLGAKNQGRPGDLIFEKAEEIKDRIATAGRIHARIRNQGARETVWVDPDFWEGWTVGGISIQLSELDTNKLRRGTIQGGVCWVTERWPGGHELQCHTGGDGSFAYDLDVQRGIVSGRVALLLRSAEIKPSLSGLGAKNQGRPGDLIFEKAEEIKDRIATAGRIHARIRNQGARETVWVDIEITKQHFKDLKNFNNQQNNLMEYGEKCSITELQPHYSKMIK